MVSPVRDEITLLEPELIKQGNKYGVKIHSKAPSIHLIRANIETEIAPIVGTEDQAKDLLTFIKQEAKNRTWNLGDEHFRKICGRISDGWYPG